MSNDKNRNILYVKTLEDSKGPLRFFSQNLKENMRDVLTFLVAH